MPPQLQPQIPLSASVRIRDRANSLEVGHVAHSLALRMGRHNTRHRCRVMTLQLAYTNVISTQQMLGVEEIALEFEYINMLKFK